MEHEITKPGADEILSSECGLLDPETAPRTKNPRAKTAKSVREKSNDLRYIVLRHDWMPGLHAWLTASKKTMNNRQMAHMVLESPVWGPRLKQYWEDRGWHPVNVLDRVAGAIADLIRLNIV